jgi:hypothetical protein
MIIRILLLVAIVFFFLKYMEKQRGRRRVGSRKRVVRSEMATLRARFHQLIQYFDPQRERDQLSRSFHQLMNTNGAGKRTEAYRNATEAIGQIISTREQDVKRIQALDKLKKRYDASRDTFSDGLRDEIDSHFQRADEILANEHFAVAIDELKMIGRLLPWLIQKGEEGRDNSVHWKSELAESKEKIRRQIADERGWFNLL